MALIAKILFPVDFSPSCVAMAAYVKRAATLLGTKVSLVHVVDLASHNGFELYLRPTPEIAEEHRSIGRHRLDSFLTTDFPIAQCPRILASGDAATQIAQIARDGGSDLIIMPTHAGIFRRMLLGSTTAKVLNDADCPVLTSIHAQTIAPRPLDHREWLCAIGLSANSERVLRYASQVTAQERGKLSIIHAVQAEDTGLPRNRHIKRKGTDTFMKIATFIARILLGLLFLVYGLNGLLQFIPMPLRSGLAEQYMGALFLSHYLVAVFLVQVVGGVLLLANRFVPLALILLGPVLVNILLFHSLMAPAGLPLALLATALWGILFYGARRAFAGVFAQQV